MPCAPCRSSASNTVTLPPPVTMTFARFRTLMHWASLLFAFALLECVIMPPILGQILDYSLVSVGVWDWAVAVAFITVMASIIDVCLVQANHSYIMTWGEA